MTEGQDGQISLRQEIASKQRAEKTWKQARLQTAAHLAYGLLALFCIIVLSTALVTSVLSIRYAVPDIDSDGNPIAVKGIEYALDFTKTILPYVATPLSVALGYFFRESQVNE